MCTFITAVVPRGADLARLGELARQHGLGFAPCTNRFVQAQLPPGSLYLRKESEGCDCDTALGGIRGRGHGDDEGGLALELARRRRLGWSERKLERWLAEKQKSGEKRGREVRERARPREQEIGGWLAFITAALAPGELQSFGLLLHFYRGDPTTERVQLRETARVPARELNAETLIHLEEDVLHLFHR